MQYNILDKKRLALLPRLNAFKDSFYLAGGTGLAILIGHRDSLDFDFFSDESFDTRKLYDKVRDTFAGMSIQKTQEEKDTLSVVIDDEVKVSFFRYPYPLIKPLIEEENVRIASMNDIACMKLSAIVSRSAFKDYADLYFIIRSLSLNEILADAAKKMPDLDQNLVLKSLVYFDDLIPEKIMFKGDNVVSFETVKEFFVAEVKKFKG